ncbi:hypothetical protein GQ54DRAFT_159294, partial [Martensiomyces pterosporus]
AVWQEIATRFTQLQSAWALESDEVKEKIKALRRELFSSILARIGWDTTAAAGSDEDDSHASRLRALAVRMAGKAGHEEIVAESHRRLKEYLAGNKRVLSGDLLPSVFSVVVGTGTGEDYEAVKSYYLDTSNPVDQRLSALAALGHAKDTDLLRETLAFALTDDVRNQDIHIVVSAVGSNSFAGDLAWKWFQDNYDLLLARYLAATNYIGELMELSTSHFVGSERAADIEEYFATKDIARYNRSIEQTVERIRTNTAWFETDREKVREWFANN